MPTRIPSPPPRRRISHADGFSLLEALVATLLLAGGVAALAWLAVASSRVQAAAREQGMATRLARDKMEQLRALAWTSDVVGSAVSGLVASPPGTLAANMPGFFDALDAAGHELPGDARVGEAAWVRRWAVAPLETVSEAMSLQVVVVPAAFAGDTGVRRMRAVGGARLYGVRARRTR